MSELPESGPLESDEADGVRAPDRPPPRVGRCVLSQRPSQELARRVACREFSDRLTDRVCARSAKEAHAHALPLHTRRGGGVLRSALARRIAPLHRGDDFVQSDVATPSSALVDRVFDHRPSREGRWLLGVQRRMRRQMWIASLLVAAAASASASESVGCAWIV
jgi:hypothetical protein